MLMLAVFAVVALGLFVFQQRRLGRRSATTETLQALVEEITAARSAAELGTALMRFTGRFPGIASLRLLLYEAQNGALLPAGDETGGALAEDHPAAKRCRELADPQESGRDVDQLIPVNDPERGLVYYLPVRGRGRLLGLLEIVPGPGAALSRATGRQGARHLARVAGTVLAWLEEATLREQVARHSGASEAAKSLGGAIERALERLADLREGVEELSAAVSGSPAAETAAALRRHLDAAVAELQAGREAGGADEEPLEIDLQTLVGAVVAQTRRELSGGVRIDVGALEPAAVRAPLRRLEALLKALLRQAAEVSPAGRKPQIRVSARAAGGQAIVAISHPEVEASERAGGAGFESAAESLGGAVRTVSGPEGWMTIELRLPVAAARGSGASRRAARARLTILLAEPDETIRRRLLHALARRGHRVVPADLAEAADLAARFPFDCALCAPDGDPDRWEPLLERIVSEIGAVAVLAGPAGESGARWAGAHLLKRPPEEDELDEFLAGVEPRERGSGR